MLAPDPFDVLGRHPDDHVGGVQDVAAGLTAGVPRPWQPHVVERGPGTPADRQAVDSERAGRLDLEVGSALTQGDSGHHRTRRVASAQEEDRHHGASRTLPVERRPATSANATAACSRP